MKDNSKTIKRIFGIILIAVLALVITSLLAASFFTKALLGKINRVEEQETLSSEQIQQILSETDVPVESWEDPLSAPTELTETLPATESAEEETVPADEEDSGIINILLVGQDRRAHQKRQRSDAMILCTINPEKKTLVMTSFLRDLYVQLPEYHGTKYARNRLNATYAIGGFEMLDDCLERNFDVHVDHNIEVDFFSFEKVIDAVGGVDIELTEPEAWVIGGGLSKGMNHLDGEQALAYARIRKIDNDFGRTNRQRKVLTALFEKARQLSILELLKLAQELLPMIATDMTDAQIIGYITELFPIWKDIEVITQSVPAEGEFYYDDVYGMSVVIPDIDKIRERIAETIG